MAANDVVARNLKRFRREAGLSLVALADAAELSKQTVAAVESGRGNPTVDTLERLARTLQVSMRALVSELGSDVLHTHESIDEWRRSGKVEVRGLDNAFGSGYVTNSLVRVHASSGRVLYAARGRGSLRHCYVVEGEIRMGPVSATVLAVAGDFVRFPAETEHCLEAVTTTALLFACTTSPQLARHADEDWF